MVNLLGDDEAPWMSINFMNFLTEESEFPDDGVAILDSDKNIRLIGTGPERRVIAVFSREAWRAFNSLRE